MSAEKRLQRLLAVVPWVAARDGPKLTEVCDRFGCTEAELLDDLDHLFLCGLYPYTPDVLIDVDVADGRVWIRYADYFSRPLHLTPGEGLALLAAGKALLEFPGADPAGPLARGLGKLAAALGVEDQSALEIAFGPAPEAVLAPLRTGAAEHRQVELEYYSFGRDRVTQRTVDPYTVFSAGGQWYVSAFCHAVDDERLFRLDRVRSARLLESNFRPASARLELNVFEPGPDDPRVVLDLEAGGRWVVEQYPTETLEELDGGRCRVRMAVTGEAWLQRLLLRLGPDCRVSAVDGPGDLGDAGSRAACRLLARYATEGPVRS